MTQEILLVDQNSYDLEACREILSRLGCRVWAVQESAMAAQLLKAHKFDVTIIGHDGSPDLDLPNLARWNDEGEDCKFILLTRDIDMDSYFGALHGIFHECLQKPPDLHLMKEVLDNLAFVSSGSASPAHG